MADPITPAPAAPAAKPAAAAPAAPAADPTLPLHERIKSLEKERDQAKRDDIVNRRAADSKIKSFGDKLKAADEYARIQRLARVNKAEAARALFGDKWHEELNTVQANGGAPTAESVQMAVEEAEERATKRTLAEIDKRDSAAREQAQKAEEGRVQSQLRAFATEALKFAKDSAKDFPHVAKRHAGEQKFAAAVAQHIRDVHDSSVQRDADGYVMRPGRVLSFKEAADALESAEVEYVKSLQPAKPSGTVPPVVKSSQSVSPSQQSQSPSQGRRTLTHDLTGRTPGEPSKYRSEDERRQAALQRYEESRSK